MAFAYILQSADGSYDVGSTRAALKRRIGTDRADGRPRRLVWTQKFRLMSEAIAMEHRVKRWSRAQKEALITSDFVTVDGAARDCSSFELTASWPPPDED